MSTLPLLTPNTNDTYNQLRSSALSVQTNCTNVQSLAQSGSVGYDQLLNLLIATQRLITLINTIAQNSALETALTTLMQTYTAQPTLAVVPLAGAMLTAANNLVTAIAEDYPRGAGTVVADRTMSAQGAVTILTTNSAGLPNALPAITAWLATVS